jgi:hypothetical protein
MNNRNSIHCALIQNLLALTMLSLSNQSSAQSQNQSAADSNTNNGEQVIICPEYVAMVKVEVSDQHGKEIASLRKAAIKNRLSGRKARRLTRHAADPPHGFVIAFTF